MRTAVILSLIAIGLFVVGSYCREELSINNGVVSLTRHEQWGRKHAICWQRECSSIKDVSSVYVGGVDIGPGYYRLTLLLNDGTSIALPESLDVGMPDIDKRVEKIKKVIAAGGVLRDTANPRKVVVALSMLFLFFALLYWTDWIQRSISSRIKNQATGK